MVVDDSKTNVYIVSRMLIEDDHNVVSAHDADEALALLDDYPDIQLLVVDWVLPTMDGPELAQVIRERYTEPYRYIIMLTAKTGDENRVIGLQSGVDDYMEKPVNPDELRARLNIASRIIQLEADLNQKLRVIDRTRREWEATTNAVPQLICLIDPDGVVIHTNRTVETWGLAALHEAASRPLTDLLAVAFEDFAAQLHTTWPRMQRRLSQGGSIEFEGSDTSSGHHFSVQMQPISKGSTDGTTFAAVTIQDISERKRLELELQEANRKSEDLLRNVLPEPIAERLRDGESRIAESHADVTVLFADLVGFTRLTTSISPDRLMDMLNEVFSAFDSLTERFGIEKIKTIGDAYMVVGGLTEESQPDHAGAIAEMALAMQETIRHISTARQQALDLRIGIATGPVVAGVIGHKRFSYDLWGDTVNTASRMQEYGIAGCIQITRATYERLNGRYVCKERGTIEVKGKGKVATYLLHQILEGD
jgi:PAS domain S-box-containing protein